MSDLTESDKELMKKAGECQKLAYCPYSNYKVGAALLSTDGQIFTGCNVENASYGLTICAERTACTKAVSQGVTSFKAMAIIVTGADIAIPCGACRQFLIEFGDIEVICCNNDASKVNRTRLNQLLPGVFDKNALDKATNGL